MTSVGNPVNARRRKIVFPQPAGPTSTICEEELLEIRRFVVFHISAFPTISSIRFGERGSYLSESSIL
jgi:hypothetical protein